MSRHSLLALLLASAVAVAAEKPKTQHAAGAAPSNKKTEAAQQRSQDLRSQDERANPQQPQQQPEKAKTEDAQEQAERAKTKDAQARTDEPSKLTSVPDAKALGMSILGNQDAPKSLVIVPWKSSELGESPAVSPRLDDARQPVDKEVFVRALRYYEIRSKTKP